MRKWIVRAACVAAVWAAAGAAAAQDASRLTFRIQPAARAQLAVWVESDDGTYFRTVLLTSAVARYGIGNRPGALEMNSGFHWPYGRREGVLPVWGHRRVEIAHQPAFRRVIFRDRSSEGAASQAPAGTFPSASYRDNADPYFCLSFNAATTRRDALDAVACASVYSSDRGRYITPPEEGHYTEPYVRDDGVAVGYPLDGQSLYPPRVDVTCSGDCPNHPDALRYGADARAVMPELDLVATATLPSALPTDVTFTVPTEWPAGTYHAYVEANTEGDYNATYNDHTYPTPLGSAWDSWAETFGYPYRGRPSVVYRIDFTLPASAMMDSYTATAPVGHGSVDGRGGSDATMYPMTDGTMADDPANPPGGGANRLQPLGGATRVELSVFSPHFCDGAVPPGVPDMLIVTPVADVKHSHEFGHLSFTAPSSSHPIKRYEVRVSTMPITDVASFLAGMPANEASLESRGLVVPIDGAAGSTVEADFGGLNPLTRYWIGVRAVDQCFVGPVTAAEMSTTAIHFTTVSPCFVATATYGTPMAGEIGALRRFRDRHLRTNAVGRALVDVYYAQGPAVADVVRDRPWLRAAARALLAPVVDVARAVDGDR